MKAHIQHQIFGYIIFFFRFIFISCITYLMQIQLSYSCVVFVYFFKSFDVLISVFSCLCTTHCFSLNCKCAMLIQTSYIIHIFTNFCVSRPLGRRPVLGASQTEGQITISQLWAQVYTHLLGSFQNVKRIDFDI